MGEERALPGTSGRGRVILLGALCALLIPFLPARLFPAAQNNVVVEQFPWQIGHLPHFDVYYYGQGGKKLFPHVERYLEDAYDRTTRVLPLSTEYRNRFPYLLYNTHNDFEQTQVTPVGEGTGGVTEAFKDRLLVGNTGPQRYLEYVSAHEFTHQAEYVYLFEGGWRSARLLKFPFYPSWLMEGLAEYTSGDLDYVTREMYLRDAATSGGLLRVDDLFNFNHVLPHQVTLAYKQSEALMHFIAQEYGPEKLSMLVSAYRGSFSPDVVLLSVLGVRQEALDKRYREFLRDSYAAAARGRAEPTAYGKKITSEGPVPRFYQNPAYSPDGTHLAYTSDERGVREIYLRNLETGKTERIVSMPYRVGIEQVHDDTGGLSFSPEGSVLAFIGESEQRDYLFLYDLSEHETRKIGLPIKTLASPSFSPDGRTIYLSGIRDGFRDLYAYHVEDGRLTQLTEGPMDEIDAMPSPDGRALFYAGERRNESGRIEYDLARLDLATGTTEYITAYPGDERYPYPSSDGKYLYFTSNRDGVNDIYRLDLENGSRERLTTVIGGNFQPRLSPDGERLIFSSFRKTQMGLYEAELASLKPREDPAEPAVVFSTAAPVAPSGPVPSSYVGPYRFRVSTDLIFPFIAYSSVDGLFLSAYWQLSEFMGNHQLLTQVSYASAAEYLDYAVQYGYTKLRPKFYLSAGGLEYFRDVEKTIKRKESIQSLLVTYPLNRFQEVGTGFATIFRRESLEIPPNTVVQNRENIALLSFTHDTTYGPYLEPTSGIALGLATQFSGTAIGSDFDYQDYIVQGENLFPLGKENVLALSSAFGASVGRDPQLFALGGIGGVRGLPRDETRFGGNRVFVASLEWRFPIVYNINYHVQWFFPDFYFKSFYGGLFVDGGVAWNNDRDIRSLTGEDWKGSAGIALRFHTFILESVPLLLNLQLARRLDEPAYVFYISPFYNIGITFPFGKGEKPASQKRAERFGPRFLPRP